MEDYELEVEGSPNSSYMALLFGVRFTVKRYGMKKYPFLFVSNMLQPKTTHLSGILLRF